MIARTFALLGTLSLCLAAGAVPAEQPRAPTGALAFDGFLARSVPLCEREAAPRCVDVAWSFADRDRDRRLSLSELESVRHGLRTWLSWKEHRLPMQQRQAVLLGLMIVDAVGLPTLVASYDSDGDGAISRPELLSDVRLDGRPLGAILRDPESVDWPSVSRRLGPIAPALDGWAKPE